MSDEFQVALKACADRYLPDMTLSGRGVVTCAGGERLFTCAYVLVRILRQTLNCQLPIQLWHFGGEEFSPVMRYLLSPFDVELVDATSFLADYPADIRNGWQLKSYAMLHSRFEEVLFLDADQVPVRDPAAAFDFPEYRESGAVFWPDIHDLSAHNPIWAMTGLPAETCPSWESGQMLVDKRRHLAALRVALYLNERADLVYSTLYGDKDTFLIAWRFTGADVAMIPYRPFIDDRVLIQRDFEGAPLFQHRTGSKWNYHFSQYKLDGFVHMDDCLAYLAELRRSWNGRQFFAPDRSARACAEEERLAQVRQTRLIVLGDRELKLELLPGHQIGEGRRVERQNWFVVETDGGMDLILHDGDRVTYRLHHVERGVWFGERLAFPSNEVSLTEMPVADPAPVAVSRDGLIEAVVSASGVGSGAGDIARERLAITLRLMLTAQPGLRPAIEAVANRSAKLAGIVDQVLGAGAVLEPLASDIELLQTGYIAPEGPGL